MSAQLHVPLLGLDELVAVDLGQLPDVDDVLELLISEARPLSTWFDFAKAYLAQGKEESFRHICNEGAKDEVLKEAERFFQRKHTYEVIQFHCGLAGLNIAKARDEKRRDVKTQLLAQALASLTAAQQLDPEEQLVSLGLGLLHVTKVGVL
jgi:RNA polymerase-associated protein CTR9